MGYKSNTKKSFLLILLYLTIATFSIKIMIGMTAVFEEFAVSDLVNKGANLFYIAIIGIWLAYHKLDKSSLGLGTMQFLLVFIFLDFFVKSFNGSSTQETLYREIPLFLSIFTYIVAYNLYLRYPYEKSLLSYAAIGITIVLCVEYLILSNGLRVTFNHSSLRLGIAYVPLIFTPLLLFNDKNKLKWACFLIIAYILIDSGKRGGLVAVIAGLLLYLSYSSSTIKKSKKIRITIIVSLVLIVFGNAIFEYLSNSEMYERLLNGSEDSDYSSGRVGIYKEVLSKYWDSGLSGLFFGHGLGSVQNFTKQGFTAHNDFIEALFDFGLIGFISYLIFYWSFIRQIVRINYKQIKGVYVYTFTLMFLLSIFSQIFIYQYLCLFTFVLGALSGTHCQVEQRINKKRRMK